MLCFVLADLHSSACLLLHAYVVFIETEDRHNARTRNTIDSVLVTTVVIEL
jgi:hypothetical protein